MAVFFTSDTHFGDHRTINIQRRPFASVSEMDEALASAWNAVVGPEDVVWHLGDFARHVGDVPALLERLHGTKHLVRGNNDPDGTATAVGWASVADYVELELDGRRVVLCHYPSAAGRQELAEDTEAAFRSLAYKLEALGIEVDRISSLSDPDARWYVP